MQRKIKQTLSTGRTSKKKKTEATKHNYITQCEWKKVKKFNYARYVYLNNCEKIRLKQLERKYHHQIKIF
jgi:hypothetical protein